MSLKVIIIEDEPSIARHLNRILSNSKDGVKVLKLLDTVEDSIVWLESNMEKCDLIFSDIQLLDGLSFEIFEQVIPTKPIIFITAFEQYTLDAFQTNGIHYVIKPFDAEDISKALEKYRVLIANTESGPNQEKLDAVMKSLSLGNPLNYKQAYLVHFQNKLIPLQVEDIAWFYTENEVVYARTFKNKSYTIESTLERISSEIPPMSFFRANRQYVLHRNAIHDIDFYFNGRLIVNVIPPAEEKIVVSKAKAPEFKNWIGNVS
ncbi:MAG: LytTR family DNA-binding domain-containing protein [Bacteroidota bacterium]